MNFPTIFAVHNELKNINHDKKGFKSGTGGFIW